MSSTPEEPEDLRPYDLLQVLAHLEVETGPTAWHTEILTSSGKLGLLWDGPPDSERVLVMCGGAVGGVLGPAGGMYFDLARALAEEGVNSVRVDYRRPGDLAACILDIAVAVDLAQRCGGKRFVVVGHSFGGAVAIGAAAALPDLVAGVVSLAGQSAGCEAAKELNGVPLLLLHGENDEIIPFGAAETVRHIAGYGAVVKLPGTGHLLTESGEELRRRLPRWLLAALGGDAQPY
jgi:pimeloyl-ACP methyl ester carboxylesterase